MEREVHSEAVLLAGLVIKGEDPCCSSVFLKGNTLWERSMMGKFVEDCLSRMGPHATTEEDNSKHHLVN